MKPLITFFILAYTISWLIWLPLFGPAVGIKGLHALPFNHAIGAFGPMIAAFITLVVTDRKSALQLLRHMLRPGSFIFIVIALFSPFILALLGMLICRIGFHTPLNINELGTNSEFPKWNLLVYSLYNIFTFGFGEETGWRGFALPRLQKKFNALKSSIILTLFWAAWHIPLFLYRPGYVNMDWIGILGWLFSLLTGSILLTWLFNSTRGSILVCAIFHATVDISFTSNFADKHVVGIMGILITVFGVLIIMIYKPKNLSDRERVTG